MTPPRKPMLAPIREAAQDHGAARFMHNSADAGVLGDCGEKAARVVLEHLRSDDGAWLTIEGAAEVDRLLGVLR